MTTPAKIVANQANARHSTGPTTPAGKARSAQNALKHGLTAAQNVIPSEDAEAFADFRDGYLDDLCPVGSLEVACVNQIVAISWRIRRIPWIESSAIRCLMKIESDLGACLLRFDRGGFITQRLPCYETLLMRGLERALTRLDALQSRRTRAEPGELELSAEKGAPPLEAVVEVAVSEDITRLSEQGPEHEAAARPVETSPAVGPGSPENSETKPPWDEL